MSVYYKFKSAKDFDSIPIEGQFVSVASLKERIFETKQLGRGTDFDLVVSNAQTDEEYADEAAMIPKNTSVLIRRVPGRRRMPIIAEQVEPKGVEDKVGELPQQPNSTLVGESSTMNYPEESEWDVFGNDLYATPEMIPAIPSNTAVDVAAVSNVDEDNKIKELIDSSGLDWNRPMQDSYGSGRGFGRGMGGRMMGGRGRGFGFGRGGGLQGNTPPPGYICHRCKVPGHFIQHCPTNGDPNFDIRRVKPPTGIPRSMLMATPDGSYALPSGAVAVLKPNEAAFEKEIEGFPTTRPVSDLPQELRCPLCKDAMKDAVLTSKCCFRTFCYKCIRDYIVTKSMCVCGVTNVLADDLVPNYTLRETISRLLDATTSSTENGGSFVQVQDMESARQGQPKVPSPTISATSKGEARQPPSKEYSLDTKEVELTSGGNLVNTLTISLDKKSGQNADPSEATPESISAKEAISPEGAPAPEGGQEKLLAGDQGKKKKKKKTRVPVSAADMQWAPYQDFGTENFSGMPLGPSAFNPYWAGGMPMGMDGYMAPFSGGMPYMGYPPGPFDVPYGGMLAQDPFAQQGYNMMHPGIPQRDLSELGTGNMGINQGRPVMSREEFEARKADVRRKREMERLGERDHSRDHGREVDRGDRGRETDRGDRGREVGSSLDVSPMKAKPRLMSQATPVDRSDRAEDRPTQSRHLSPRSKKRRASDQDDAADKKLKGSVFSRISFPEAGSKKSRTEPSNGLKDKQQERETNGHRDESKAGKGTTASSEGRRGRGHDHESSEEEYHFKRRPSSRREAEDEGRGKKERGEHGHNHDRSKRR